MLIFLTWTAVLVAVLFLYFHKTYSRFSEYGVKHMKVVPLFGNMLNLLLRKEHFTDALTNGYNTFAGERFIGTYQFTTPMTIIQDIELAKKITVKDFEYFLDRRGFTDENVDPLFGRNLFSLKGQEWKDMRSTLSPAFTSSKIKLMVPLMEEVGEQMIRALKTKIETADGHIDLDCKDLSSRYANDVIASCAFGLIVDSHTNENNKFYEMGKKASTFKFRQILIALVMTVCPTVVKKLNISFLSKETKDFFIDLVQTTMKDRETRNIIRPDMIHLLIEAKKGNLSHDDKGSDKGERDTGFATVEESSVGKKTSNRTWSDTDLIAQAILFFIAGFDTVSASMCFMLYELARNPEIQERLAQEIKEHNIKNGGKLTFTSIQNMSYMDMVVSETLRLWSPGIAMERKCVKDYNLGKPNSKAEKDFIIKKGEIVCIPAWCFQRDPKLFPDPEKFDPERFSDQNKHNINTTAYMPFGIGPRNCIGSRFALCEMKVFLYQILLNFEIYPGEKTTLTGELDRNAFTLTLKGGHWLRFKCRNEVTSR